MTCECCGSRFGTVGSGDEGIDHPTSIASTPTFSFASPSPLRVAMRGATSRHTEKRRHATATAKRGLARGSGRYAHCFESPSGREDLGPPTPSRSGVRTEARLGYWGPDTASGPDRR